MYEGFKDSVKLCAASKSWNGVSGADKLNTNAPKNIYGRIPQTSEVISTMQQTTALIHYGPGNLLNYLYPTELAGLNLPHCKLAILMDRAVTYEIRMRQERRGPERSKPAREAEAKSSTVAAFLSLSGVSSVAVNQWETTIENNEKKMKQLVPILCDAERGSIGVAIRRIGQIKEPPEAEGDSRGKSAKGGKKSKTPSAGKGRGKGKGAKEDEEEAAKPAEPEILDSPVYRFNTILYGIPNVALA